MNATEGLLRIAKIVRWIGTGLAYLWGLVAAVFTFAPNVSDRLGMAIGGAIAALVCYGIGRGLAWIIEGFAAPKSCIRIFPAGTQQPERMIRTPKAVLQSIPQNPAYAYFLQALNSQKE